VDRRSRELPKDFVRTNRRIRVPEVRVLGADGAQLGVMPTREAMRLAEEAGLDLVEISPRAVPPVCRIMDYGKFKFDEAKQKRQARKKQTVVQVKEVKFRPKTDEHDYQTKVRHIRRFLEEGNRVRMVVQFRGREIVHPQVGRLVLEQVLRDLADVARIEHMPGMEGRSLAMTIGPKKIAEHPVVPAP
jgi:translation initiation factor IF-3